MSVGLKLIKSNVADYCNKSNRHQEKTMPETVFLFVRQAWRVARKRHPISCGG